MKQKLDTPQKAYDAIVAHLRKQGVRSVISVQGRPQCRYRTPSGLYKCAAGGIMADDVYRPSLEGGTVYHLRVLEALIASGVDMVNPEVAQVVRELQQVHDQVEDVSRWEGEFLRVAGENKVIFRPRAS